MKEKQPLMKRLIDLGVVIPLAVVAVPLCVLLCILIRAESPGSPLFVQWRVGRHRRPFRILKLRTMAADTAHVPSHEVESLKITRLGAILRQLKLDELPQLWNVLAGTMSLVGPRPCLPTQNELVEARERRGLFEFLPGVTGPAQLLNVDMSEPVRLAEVEIEYFARATPITDLGIVFRTFLGRGRGDAALRGR
ncbi:sugar transferase [Sphingosinicella sp. LHD-64]|uniref:sugar transferase n=1 Tax=Sphingosinicella sp. LHD-64 TaxID=3072139 RepID=UPI00280D877C|nr:sugar transferase [Sphingosinicella sp. LHD-64]MDQ8757217.1 sugar transferase [Sphingosinicella sp. LHD-64]